MTRRDTFYCYNLLSHRVDMYVHQKFLINIYHHTFRNYNKKKFEYFSFLNETTDVCVLYTQTIQNGKMQLLLLRQHMIHFLVL